jgi:hypothetical protein
VADHDLDDIATRRAKHPIDAGPIVTYGERDALVAAVRAAIDVRNDPDGSLAVWDALDEALAPFEADRG